MGNWQRRTQITTLGCKNLFVALAGDDFNLEMLPQSRPRQFELVHTLLLRASYFRSKSNGGQGAVLFG